MGTTRQRFASPLICWGLAALTGAYCAVAYSSWQSYRNSVASALFDPHYHQDLARTGGAMAISGVITVALALLGLYLRMTPVQVAVPGTVPPGWYPAPDDLMINRWWDGHSWTPGTQPIDRSWGR